jgi:hypothetical protein
MKIIVKYCRLTSMEGGGGAGTFSKFPAAAERQQFWHSAQKVPLGPTTWNRHVECTTQQTLGSLLQLYTWSLVATTGIFDKHLSTEDTCHVVGTVHLYKELTDHLSVSWRNVCYECDKSQMNDKCLDVYGVVALTRLTYTGSLSGQHRFFTSCQLVYHTELGWLTDPPTTAIPQEVEVNRLLAQCTLIWPFVMKGDPGNSV